MKHASTQALRDLDALLAQVRRIDSLSERKPGIFYRRSSAFLHFHEDAGRLFADVKFNGIHFQRMPVSTERQRREFIDAVRKCLAVSSPA